MTAQRTVPPPNWTSPPRIAPSHTKTRAGLKHPTNHCHWRSQIHPWPPAPNKTKWRKMIYNMSFLAHWYHLLFLFTYSLLRCDSSEINFLSQFPLTVMSRSLPGHCNEEDLTQVVNAAWKKRLCLKKWWNFAMWNNQRCMTMLRGNMAKNQVGNLCLLMELSSYSRPH